MSVSSLHSIVLENTTNVLLLFYSFNTTMPNYNWVTISTHTQLKFLLWSKWIVQAFFFFFVFRYTMPYKRKQRARQNHAHVSADHVVQTIVYFQCSVTQPLLDFQNGCGVKRTCLQCKWRNKTGLISANLLIGEGTNFHKIRLFSSFDFCFIDQIEKIKLHEYVSRRRFPFTKTLWVRIGQKHLLKIDKEKKIY